MIIARPNLIPKRYLSRNTLNICLIPNVTLATKFYVTKPVLRDPASNYIITDYVCKHETVMGGGNRAKQDINWREVANLSGTIRLIYWRNTWSKGFAKILLILFYVLGMLEQIWVQYCNTKIPSNLIDCRDLQRIDGNRYVFQNFLPFF